MKLSAQAILILHAIVTVSLQQPTVGRHSRSVREEANEDIDGSGLERPLLYNEAPSDFSQDHSEVVAIHSDTPTMIQEPLLIDIKYVADEETRVASLQDENLSTTEIHHLNVPASYTEFLVVNVSLPIHANDLISRLVNAANKASYNEKLDIARRLTSFTHELMSSIEENLANAMLI